MFEFKSENKSMFEVLNVTGALKITPEPPGLSILQKEKHKNDI